MFIRAPKKAAMPVSRPRRRPTPTAISPSVITQANHVSWLPAIKVLMKSRYHSKEMGGRPCSGIAAALSQYPRRAAPPWVHSGLLNLSRPASSHENPTKSRMGSHGRPARELLKRKRVTAGPSISTSELPAALRSSKRARARTIDAIQKATVTTGRRGSPGAPTAPQPAPGEGPRAAHVADERGRAGQLAQPLRQVAAHPQRPLLQPLVADHVEDRQPHGPPDPGSPH